ncbi:recombinase family protein [Rhizobium leguminosarum bv. viciae]|uniref:recombinase family protein n=1 Tax=Rhizobium leguminosarum TaxID=384 RepID=UPI00103C4C8A|nr:recombinase family protein [Rhizobium leguminosarum]TBZ36421.1 recombinase family protein [Rhizobium leguminosarum bv. viciae]
MRVSYKRSETGPIRAFLYARSGSEAQNAPTAKADDQLQRLRKYASDRSFVVVGEARDAAKSGASLSRPGLALMMKQATCSPPAFDVLLATDRPRLARGVEVFNAIASRLTGAGIQIEYVDGSSMFVHDASLLESR